LLAARLTTAADSRHKGRHLVPGQIVVGGTTPASSKFGNKPENLTLTGQSAVILRRLV